MATTQELVAAIREGDVAQVKTLLAAQPELAEQPTASSASPLLTAVYFEQSAVAEAILEYVTPDLFEAVALGYQERAAALLALQPELANAVAPDGFTPLTLAAFFGRLELTELLLRHGAHVNLASQNVAQVMPLHSAVAAQQLAIAQTLIAHGADVNAQQPGAFTPLHGAAQNGQIDMIELLLRHGADINARASRDRSALDFAREEQHAAVIALLEQVVAQP